MEKIRRKCGWTMRKGMFDVAGSGSTQHMLPDERAGGAAGRAREAILNFLLG